MKRVIYFMYGLICYLIFFASFLYLIGFVENVGRFEFVEGLQPLFSKTLDSGKATLSSSVSWAINLALIALFGLQHSAMARPGFKEKWTKVVPKPLERSTYVLFASLALIVLFIGWQPIKATIWDVSNTTLGSALFYISLLGWMLLTISTYLIDHFELFGLRQVFQYTIQNKEPDQLKFQTPGFYKYIRHPIYFSFLVAFWFAPVMTVGHFIFSLGMTGYILIGIYHEEKDLIKHFGDKYRSYKQNVPKLIPFVK